MGAAGRDFHNFNCLYRDNKDYEVVAFTATQIPDIEGRKYPAKFAGKLYPEGIPIYAEDQLTMLNTSLSSSKHLLQLINDVLDISKIQAGKLSLYIEEDVNLYDEIQAVVNMADPLLQKQNALLEQPIEFIQDIDDSLPLTACDRRRIRQVLLNLLFNAIKFTEQGSITLSVKKKGEESIFAVMDTGPGIPQEMQARIFEPFIQSSDGIKQTQGTGLGLHISRSLIQAHGGDLWVESKSNEGTTIFFTLPFRPPMKQ